MAIAMYLIQLAQHGTEAVAAVHSRSGSGTRPTRRGGDSPPAGPARAARCTGIVPRSFPAKAVPTHALGACGETSVQLPLAALTV